MISNPYSTILGLTKSDEPSSDIMIGEVISASPIVVRIGELQIDKDNILIADYLLSGYARDYRSTRVIPEGSNTGRLQYTDTLESGDQLAILRTTDKQTYIIVARLREV